MMLNKLLVITDNSTKHVSNLIDKYKPLLETSISYSSDVDKMCYLAKVLSERYVKDIEKLLSFQEKMNIAKNSTITFQDSNHIIIDVRSYQDLLILGHSRWYISNKEDDFKKYTSFPRRIYVIYDVYGNLLGGVIVEINGYISNYFDKNGDNNLDVFKKSLVDKKILKQCKKFTIHELRDGYMNRNIWIDDKWFPYFNQKEIKNIFKARDFWMDNLWQSYFTNDEIREILKKRNVWWPDESWTEYFNKDEIREIYIQSNHWRPEKMIEYCFINDLAEFVDKEVRSSTTLQSLFVYSVRMNRMDAFSIISNKVDDWSVYGSMALNEAIRNNNLDILKMLMTREEIDPSADGCYNFFLAVQEGYTEIVRLLLQDKRIDPSYNENWAMRTAERNNDVEIMDLLKENKR